MTATHKQQLSELQAELELLRDEYPKLSDDDLFVAWFLFAFVTGKKAEAVTALTGSSHEKGIDAIHVDHRAKLVTVVQGKYRRSLMSTAEKREDVIGFASIAARLSGDDEEFSSFVTGLEGIALGKAEDARDAVLNRQYRLNLHFATLGRCSVSLEDEARRLVRKAVIPAAQRPQLSVLTGNRIMAVFADYLDGVAPPVPSVELAVEGKPQEKYEDATGVSSFTFSASGWEIGQLVNQYGVKLFARNIRGYLGETGINHEIRETLRRDPASFWYLNNGVTIVCDEATLESSSGRERMILSNPQIINGQQTSYALAAEPKGANRAEVSIRVISVAKDGTADNFAAYDKMVSRIVEATNSQNKIKAADLRSNDRLQVGLERSLHQLGYFYQRKRAGRSEIARVAAQHEWKVTKESLAKAVAGCENASLVRRGTDPLFEEPRYRRIFDRASRQLLCCWWLAKSVGWEARGGGETQWAKYVVLQFLWTDLGPAIRANQVAFVEVFEDIKYDGRYEHLQRAVRHAFKGVLAYYRAERGVGPDKIEISAFFKRQDAYDGFAEFRKSAKNSHLDRYEKAAARFSSSIDR